MTKEKMGSLQEYERILFRVDLRVFFVCFSRQRLADHCLVELDSCRCGRG